jgi:hypothetical protein
MGLRFFRTLSLVLLFAFLGSTGSAAEPNAVSDTPELGPVAKKRIQWFLKTTVEAYDTVGDRNPNWDRPARAVLRAEAANWGHFPRRGGDEDRIMLEKGEAAIQAGCNDPLVLYAHARAMAFYRIGATEVAKIDRRAVEGFGKRRYTASYTANAMMRFAEDTVRLAPADDKALKTARASVDEAIALLPEAFAEVDIPTDELIGVLRVAAEASQVIEN